MIKKFLTALTLWSISGISGLVSAQEKVTDPHPETLRVISYNTWYVFNHRKQIPAGKKWINSQQPDVVALQELTNINPKYLQGLAEGWKHPHSALLKNSGFSVGLTSRWPITVVEKKIKGMHHGYLHAKTNGVHYFVVHLSPFKWEVRQREAKTIMAAIEPLLKKNEKVIVLGDFNAVSKSDKKYLEKNAKLVESMAKTDAKHGHVQNLKQGKLDYEAMHIFTKKLKDTAIGHLSNKPEERKTLDSGERIDFILASENLYKRVTKNEVSHAPELKNVSDHYPVITDFSSKKK